MTDKGRDVVRAIDWQQTCPWFCLGRTFRIAFRLRLMMLGAIGVVLTYSGWAMLGWAFSGDPIVAATVADAPRCPWVAPARLVPDQPMTLPAPMVLPRKSAASSDWPLQQRGSEPVVSTWEELTRPLRRIFQTGLTTGSLAYFSLCGVWLTVVWAFFGGAITRCVAVEFAAGERLGLLAMFRDAASGWLARVAAPLLPLSFVALGMTVILIAGLLLRSGAGTVLVGVFYPLILLGSLLLVLLTVGVLFGAALMWPAMAAEGNDCWEALNRSYSYTFQRPLTYLFHVAVATGIGLLGWILVANLASAVVHLAHCGLTWGAGQQRMAELLAHSESTSLSGAEQFGMSLLRFFDDSVRLIGVGFVYSYFWTAATFIYFLLRRDVDGAELDEIYLDDQDEAYVLPTLTQDASGAPIVTDPPS